MFASLEEWPAPCPGALCPLPFLSETVMFQVPDIDMPPQVASKYRRAVCFPHRVQYSVQGGCSGVQSTCRIACPSLLSLACDVECRSSPIVTKSFPGISHRVKCFLEGLT